MIVQFTTNHSPNSFVVFVVSVVVVVVVVVVKIILGLAAFVNVLISACNHRCVLLILTYVGSILLLTLLLANNLVYNKILPLVS